MKKSLIGLIMFGFIFLISGCTVDYHVIIDKNENAQVKIVSKVDKVIEKEEVERLLLETLNAHFLFPQEYQYEIYETDSHIVVELVSSDQKEFTSFILYKYGLPGNSKNSRWQYPFYARHLVDATVIPANSPINKIVNFNELSENTKINLHVTLPFRVESHNANVVSNDGKTLSWIISPIEPTTIHITYIVNKLYIPILFLGAIGIGILLIRKLN